MQKKQVERYVCEFCGEEYEWEDRHKCASHEQWERDELVKHAYAIKKICQYLKKDRPGDNTCGACPFYDSSKRKYTCKLSGDTMPCEWQLPPYPRRDY